ncbi:MAG TPA: cyclic nucleotide-binding domain-containing protein [Bacteroidia bacterium]|mgnify:CR=1 FL=1|nr:cyclic nucleotide-binding domain-containing protein [Bacteroidia bacterium]HNP97728.1 cyclic nucleotide-binding domain-containing protein [Bacteroidia bacterium]
MIDTSVQELLQSVEIFKGIPAELLEQLAGRLEKLRFQPTELIIQKGEEGNAMFVLATGKVKVHDGEHTIAVMEPGNYFGEFSLLDEAPRSMSVSAVDEVHLFKISREQFFGLLQSQPEVAKKIISALTRRLRSQNESIIRQLRTREEELSRLVDERTKELKLRNEEISLKNQEITANVNYAKRIQTAILPDIDKIRSAFQQAFVLYRPKDIVSGDFYSFFPQPNGAILIAADCTGHGVTGAFLSVVGNSLLNQIVAEKRITDPGKILDTLHVLIVETLNQRTGESTDGMDIALCSVDLKNNLLTYAGANRPLWLVRDGELITFAADKYPIGGLQIVHDENFKTHSIELKKNDTFYIFSDGYADQFGGELGKKFMTKKLKETLISIRHLSMEEQRSGLNSVFDEWKGNHEQIDDVLIMGVRI